MDFPWGLGVVFVVGVLLLGASIYLLLLRGSESPRKEKVPEWIFSAAYPAFFLLLPFIMLISTMLFFPCWWQNCP